jgi:tRNA (guanine37-N1)-methyltransferase
MKIEVVTLFPDLVQAALRHGVLGRALERGLVQVGYSDPRTHAEGPHRAVDDRPFGGGPGMVGSPVPWAAAIDDSAGRLGGSVRRVHLSAQGRRFTQAAAREVVAEVLTSGLGLVLVCSRYEGLDERVVQSRIDVEWSMGDYVLSGGEFAALSVIDVLARLLPGVLGDERSAQQESFSEARLDWPHYTRPPEWEGRQVPAVLLSGHHAAIERWRRGQSALRTSQRRPDLLAQSPLSTLEHEDLSSVLVEREVTEHG